MKLTFQQKLDALAYRFYQGAEWVPKEGDYYTTSRADLELYQVVSVGDDVVRTRYTEGSDAISEWPAGEFLTGGFGPKRVLVPKWVLAPRCDKRDHTPSPSSHVAGSITPQAIRQTAAWECIEEELRDELRRAADALEASEKEAARLRKMVERRDEFIVGQSLWDDFKGASHEAE